MIKAILFDIDGVLIDSRLANEKFYRGLIRHAGYPDPPETLFADSFHRSAWDNIARMTGETDEAKIRRVWEMLGQVTYPFNLVKVPQGAQNVVKLLTKNGYLLGLVTNRVRLGVKHFFRIFGHQHDFDAIVTFEDVRRPKPDPEPVLLALTQLGIKPQEAVYIGDSASDMEAARTAGVYFIAFNNPGLSCKLNVNNFTKLPGMIKNLL
ncbi:HAD family hydrolase [Patescibacteria group bacterium]|nr:HAD family hydrolase [Patescibacteria group bacterium]MBU1472874.1 HAD family hydrolase [Patescibacteria group bacterium]MBU2460064.1 HAD family hydrolase [Patescibacteria group bacterium]MBU2544760.1 HAD family hydrolase [Patescibacteria group bacterium]